MKTEKLNFRSVAMKRAYIIAKETGCTFADALKQAWQLYRNFRDAKTTEIAGVINHFDWNYNRSDDNRVYMQWSNIKSALCKEIAALPTSFVTEITNKLNCADDIKSFVNVRPNAWEKFFMAA